MIVYMATKEEIKQLVKQWVEIDNQQFKLKQMIDKIKEQKKEIEPKLFEFMGSKEEKDKLQKILTKKEEGGGSVNYIQTKVTIPLKKDELKSIILNNIKDPAEATAIYDKIIEEQSKRKKVYTKIVRKRDSTEV